jgi:aminoglycoside phosphotransferase family enzyme/predicted kinase
MREPSFYEDGTAEVEVIETPLSIVFLAGDRAYKVKREITLPFLDYGTVERRREFCHEEVRLNRRLAPDAYLGVRAIVPHGTSFALAEASDGSAIEYAVEMRRLPRNRGLHRLIASGRASAETIGEIARRIARFHEQASLAPAGYGGSDGVKQDMDENLRTVLSRVGSVVERDFFAGVERFCNSFILANRDLLDARVARGRVREGHGDLRAEHVLLEDGGVTVYDCVEFSERLRYIDVASDLAFLYMDLERLGAPALAKALGREYAEHSGDADVLGLLPFFGCYRAFVRLKLTCIQLDRTERGDQGRSELLSEASALVSLAGRLVWRARLPHVLVFCGLPASGKSTLAEEISRRSGLPHLSSDVIRKALTGTPVTKRGSSEIYEPRFTMLTYDDLLVEALELLDAEGGTIVDATFGQRLRRRVLADAANRGGARVLFCECRAPEAVLKERARAREREPERGSDATWDVVREQIDAFEPLDDVPARDHLVLRTDRPVGETLEEIDAFVNRAIDAVPCATAR